MLVEGPEVVADGALARRLIVRAEGPKVRVGEDSAAGTRNLKPGKTVEIVALGALATAASRCLGAFLWVPKFRLGKLTASLRFAVPGFLFEETHLREIRAGVFEVVGVQVERDIGVAAAVPVHLEAVGVFRVVHSSIHEVIRALRVEIYGGIGGAGIVRKAGITTDDQEFVKLDEVAAIVVVGTVLCRVCVVTVRAGSQAGLAFVHPPAWQEVRGGVSGRRDRSSAHDGVAGIFHLSPVGGAERSRSHFAHF